MRGGSQAADCCCSAGTDDAARLAAMALAVELRVAVSATRLLAAGSEDALRTQGGEEGRRGRRGGACSAARWPGPAQRGAGQLPTCASWSRWCSGP